MQQSFTKANLPVNLRNKPEQVQELFIKTANETKAQGSNFTQAVALANKLANELDTKLQAEALAKQKPKADVKQVLKQGLVDRRKDQLLSALDMLDDSDEELEEPEELTKAQVLPTKQIKSTEFDKQGRLVTILDDGTRVVSKNSAPADNINQSVAVQVNPVFDYVQMNTTANLGDDDFVPGMLTWNEPEDCLDVVQNDGTRTQVGLENYIEVINNSAQQFYNGQVVMFSSVSAEEIPAVLPMIASPDMEPLYIVGVLTMDLAPNQRGRATVLGKVRDLDTTGSNVGETWQQGDLLWVHPTITGAMTRVRPTAPYPAISVAAVLKVSSTAGLILVRPTIFPKLSYGKFTSSQNQFPLATNTPYAVKFEQSEFSSGVSVQDLTKIVCSKQGLYSFDFRLQVTSTNSSQTSLYIWARVNGADVALTTTQSSMAGNGFQLTPSWNFVLSLNAGDYFELMYAVSGTAVHISAPAATTFCPATPSAVMKVNQFNL